MKKVVLNRTYNQPFALSDKAKDILEERGMPLVHVTELFNPVYRDEPWLVEVVEKLGQDASWRVSKLQVLEFDDTHHGYTIKWDGNYEDLVLVPILRLSAIVGKTAEEIMNHANAIGIRTSR
jgi:hypothetical protein